MSIKSKITIVERKTGTIINIGSLTGKKAYARIIRTRKTC